MNWAEVESAVQAVAGQIKHKPDAIVAVVRGGLIPGRLLSKHLDVRRMFALSVEKNGISRRVVSRIDTPISGLHLLLVEDVLETGDSLQEAKQYLESCGAAVETLSLYTTPRTKIAPDHFISVLQVVPSFPWD